MHTRRAPSRLAHSMHWLSIHFCIIIYRALCRRNRRRLGLHTACTGSLYIFISLYTAPYAGAAGAVSACTLHAQARVNPRAAVWGGQVFHRGSLSPASNLGSVQPLTPVHAYLQARQASARLAHCMRWLGTAKRAHGYL